jgi:Spy/CpxP family protein refolding chaperone
MEATPSAPQQQETSRGCRPGGRRIGMLLFLLVFALVAGLAGGYLGKSFAQGFGHFHGRSIGSADPAKMDEHVDRAIRHFAIEVDATPAQKEKLAAIAKSAARDLAPLREKLALARKQAIGLVGAADVDRAAFERLRAEQIQLADAGSKRLAQALADAADVLTPAQRRKIADHLQRRVERFERRSRG